MQKRSCENEIECSLRNQAPRGSQNFLSKIIKVFVSFSLKMSILLEVKLICKVNIMKVDIDC